MVRKECDEGQRCRILKSDYLGGGGGSESKGFVRDFLSETGAPSLLPCLANNGRVR